MIEIEFPHKTYNVINKFEELSIDQYEEISTMLMDANKDAFEKHFELLVYLGVDEDDVDLMDMKSVLTFVKEFHSSKLDIQFKDKFEIDGYEYIGIPEGHDNPVISPKVLKKIEQLVKSRHKGYIAEIFAVMIKRSDLSGKEHYENAHIKQKRDLVRKQLDAADILPYVVYATENILTNIKDITDELS